MKFECLRSHLESQLSGEVKRETFMLADNIDYSTFLLNWSFMLIYLGLYKYSDRISKSPLEKGSMLFVTRKS